MPLIAHIRQSKNTVWAIALLAIAMLNGLFIQAYSPIPLQMTITHTMSEDGGEHLGHEQPAPMDCSTSDSVCKTQCAWSCQLSQAVPMLDNAMPVAARYSTEIPVYFKHERTSSLLDRGLRPPISA